MNEKEIREGNKLIAEFMGLTQKDESKKFIATIPEFLMWYDDDKPVGVNLQYHSSWYWQIPSYGKIARLLRDMVSSLDKAESDKYLRWLDKYESAIFVNNPEIGCKIIVEGIKWYNTLSP